MKKYKFTVPYFKKNFNVKNFCKELDNLIKYKALEPPITDIIIYHIIFEFEEVPSFNVPVLMNINETTDWDKYVQKVDADFLSKKNQKFRKWMFDSRDDGTLLQKLSNNFKLIYLLKSFETHSLVFSKQNHKYYYLIVTMDDNYYKNRTTHHKVHGSAWYTVKKSFKNKISKKKFADVVDNFYKSLNLKSSIYKYVQDDIEQFLNEN